MTREEALRRWAEAKRVKRDMTERMIKEAVEAFEMQHGEKPKYIEVW